MSKQSLINIAKDYNSAIGKKDAGKLENTLSSGVVLRADDVTVKSDINGKDKVVAYFKDFFDGYDFERSVHFDAACDNSKVVFSILTDKGTTPKKGNSKKPSNVINLQMLGIDGDGKIREIHIARQLTYDEAEKYLKKIPDYHNTSFNPEKLGNELLGHDEEREKLHLHLASLWNKMFSENDVSKADETCASNLQVHNLLVSEETKSLDAWKDNLKHIFSNWECKGNDSRIAVTPGNKAFVWWKTTGNYKDKSCTVWGITFLVFNEKKISEAASIYQPFPGMREALLK